VILLSVREKQPERRDTCPPLDSYDRRLAARRRKCPSGRIRLLGAVEPHRCAHVDQPCQAKLAHVGQRPIVCNLLRGQRSQAQLDAHAVCTLKARTGGFHAFTVTGCHTRSMTGCTHTSSSFTVTPLVRAVRGHRLGAYTAPWRGAERTSDRTEVVRVCTRRRVERAHDSVSRRAVSEPFSYAWRGFSCPQAVTSGFVCSRCPTISRASPHGLGFLISPRYGYERDGSCRAHF
jgi:hypothetical protein